MLRIGLIIAALTEKLEQLLWVGAFFLSPSRIYIVVLLFSAIFTHLWLSKTTKSGALIKEYTLAVTLLLTISIVSAWQSSDLGYSLKRVLNATSIYVLPILVCFYLRANQSKHDWGSLLKSTGKTICYLGLFVSVFGLIQSATGWLQHSSEIRPLLGIPFRRINSVFQDPNFLAYFLVFPLWLLVVGDQETTGIKSLSARYSIVALIAINIAITGSRGGQMMILAAIGSHFLYLVFKEKQKYIVAFEIAAVIIFPLTLLVLSRVGFEFLWQHMTSYDNSTDSAFSRVLAWYSGIEIYLRSPWLGVGPGNFVTLNKGIYLPNNYVATWVAERISLLAGHSNVLETLVETGPIGLFAYFWMQLTVYKGLLKAQIRNPKFAVYRSIYFAAAIGNSVITYFPIFLMILIGILLYLTEDSTSFTKKKENEKII